MAFDVVSSFATFQVLSTKASPPSSKHSRTSSGLRFIHITVPSDGNPNHVPTDKDCKKIDPPTLYLERCGHIWAKSHRLDRSYSYYLQALPHGYTFWQKPRPGNPRHIDGWLYGHPNRKRFTSPNEFFTHLQYLVENQGVSMGCPCRQCTGPAGVLGPLCIGPGSTTTSSTSTPSVQQVRGPPASSPAHKLERPRGRPPKHPPTALISTSNVGPTHGQFKDEEGTPDVVQGLFHKLEKDGQLTEEIDEKLSPDFEALRLSLKEWQEQTGAQPAWAPRAGEIVLFVRDLDSDCTISYENSTRTFKIYDDRKKRFLGYPAWEAGVISQETVRPFELSLEDILNEKNKKHSVSYYGYRVEPMPAPNQPDKSLSLRYTYVPMHHIRPFAFWKELLNGITTAHESIANAQTIMATAALVGRHRFKGNWPNASILCSGIYVGAEFIQCGDLVRLAAPTGPVTDFMEVRQIKLSFANLKQSLTGLELESSGIFLAGKAFTVSPSKTLGAEGLYKADIYPDYGPLFWLHEPSRLYQVSLAKVLGRCFEPDAMRLWFPQAALSGNDPKAVLTLGKQGTLNARDLSAKTDKRRTPGQAWFWADTRMQALDLHSLNGIEACSHDRRREDKLEAGQKALKVLGRPTAKNQADMRQAAERQKVHAGDALGMGKQMSQQASDLQQGDATEVEHHDSDGSDHSDGEDKSPDEEAEITRTVTTPMQTKKRSAEEMVEDNDRGSAPRTLGDTTGKSSTDIAVKTEDEEGEDPIKMLQRFKAQKISA